MAARLIGDVFEDVRIGLEALTGEDLSGNLQEKLKSGVVLCNVLNVIQPGRVNPDHFDYTLFP